MIAARSEPIFYLKKCSSRKRSQSYGTLIPQKEEKNNRFSRKVAVTEEGEGLCQTTIFHGLRTTRRCWSGFRHRLGGGGCGTGVQGRGGREVHGSNGGGCCLSFVGLLVVVLFGVCFFFFLICVFVCVFDVCVCVCLMFLFLSSSLTRDAEACARSGHVDD